MRVDDWWLTPQRVAVHVPTATAVLADVHLGYAAARQRRGDAIPQMSVPEALQPLEYVVSRHQVQRVVVAGDLFEEGCRPELVAELVEWLERVQVQLELVPGNHDGKHAGTVATSRHCRFRFAVETDLEVGGWCVLHGDEELPAPTARKRVLHGHVHPIVLQRGWRWPCYLRTATRFVLPAFSGEAAGVNVLWRPQWRGYRCWVVAENQVRELGVLR